MGTRAYRPWENGHAATSDLDGSVCTRGVDTAIARGAADRVAVRMRTGQEVAGIRNAIAANTRATSDRMHAATVSGINEADNCAGVDGGSLQAGIHGGSRVFQDTGNPGNAYSTDAPYAQPPSG